MFRSEKNHALFLTYVNDISSNISAITRMFADDTKIRRELANVEKIALSRSYDKYDSDQLAVWTKKWNLRRHFVITNTIISPSMGYSVIYHNCQCCTLNRQRYSSSQLRLVSPQHFVHCDDK